MANEDRLMIGAMSGTSADGVDVALVGVSGRGVEMTASLLAHHLRPYDPILRRSILDVRSAAVTTLPNVAWIAREVSIAHAAAINELLLAAGVGAKQIAGVAAHGQTLYHDPPDTMQSLDPSLIAAETGCRIVSDFRRADCAAGGQGAPLVPFADFCLFRHAERNRVLLNVGGIANVTFIPAGAPLEEVTAFDTGPGNCISDDLVRKYDRTGQSCDLDGRLAAQGVPIHPLLKVAFASPYFLRPPPKSTDGPAMIKIFTDALAELGRTYPLQDLLKTACVMTAETILRALKKFLSRMPDEIVVSGGGMKNQTLMNLMRQDLGEVPVLTTDDLGVSGQAKEAIAFALLGAATLDNEPSNVPSATGARRRVILGSVTPPP